MRALEPHIGGMLKMAMTSMMPTCTCASLQQTGVSPGPPLRTAHCSIVLQGAVLAGRGGVHILSSPCNMQLPHPIQLPHAAGLDLLGASLSLDMTIGIEYSSIYQLYQ